MKVFSKEKFMDIMTRKYPVTLKKYRDLYFLEQIDGRIADEYIETVGICTVFNPVTHEKHILMEEVFEDRPDYTKP